MHPVMLAPARVVVDPNGAARGRPDLTVARYSDADRVPVVGEIVLARQPDEDGSDYVGIATVIELNAEYGLIYLRVDWASFREILPFAAESQTVHFHADQACERGWSSTSLIATGDQGSTVVSRPFELVGAT